MNVKRVQPIRLVDCVGAAGAAFVIGADHARRLGVRTMLAQNVVVEDNDGEESPAVILYESGLTNGVMIVNLELEKKGPVVVDEDRLAALLLHFIRQDVVPEA